MATLILAFRDHQGHDQPTEAQLGEILTSLLTDEHTQFFLAGASDDSCLGYVQQRYRLSLWTLALQADIEDLFVMPAVRRQGVGALLIEFAVECARSQGCRQISVDTNERNLEALTLYEKHGFSGVSPRWSGGQRVLLRRRL